MWGKVSLPPLSMWGKVSCPTSSCPCLVPMSCPTPWPCPAVGRAAGPAVHDAGAPDWQGGLHQVGASSLEPCPTQAHRIRILYARRRCTRCQGSPLGSGRRIRSSRWGRLGHHVGLVQWATESLSILGPLKGHLRAVAGAPSGLSEGAPSPCTPHCTPQHAPSPWAGADGGPPGTAGHDAAGEGSDGEACPPIRAVGPAGLHPTSAPRPQPYSIPAAPAVGQVPI